MEKMKMKRRKRPIRILVACGVILAGSVGLWRWIAPLQPQVCRLPDGSTMTLVGVTYGRHHRWTDRVGGTGLWGELQSLFHPKLAVSSVETPTDALVLWTKLGGAKVMPFFIANGSRTEVSDLMGNRQIAEVDHYPRSQSQSLNVAPLLLPTFPHRDKDLTVSLYRLSDTYTRPDAEFHVTNPMSGNYPRWTPEPIPATHTSGDLQVTLSGVSISDRSMHGQVFQNGRGYGGMFGLIPNTNHWGVPLYGEDRRVVAHLHVKGKPWAQWGVSEMWLTDATGNLWQANNETWLQNGVTMNHLSYVSPANGEALRYTVACNGGTAAQFPSQDLWALPSINVPARGQRLSIGAVHGDKDASVKLLGITGIGSSWAAPSRSGAQPRQDIPIVYLEVTGACRPYLEARDEAGRRVAGGGGQNVADKWLQPDTQMFEMVGNRLMEHTEFGPIHGTRILLYPLQVPASSKRFKLTFAVNKTRTFEFTVPPNAGLPAH